MSLVNYERQLFKRNEKNFFTIRWGGVVLRNINKDDTLVIYEDLEEYHKMKNIDPVWILCMVLIFKNGTDFFPVYACEHCKSMDALDCLSLDQSSALAEDPDVINKKKCIHSQMVEDLISRSGRTWQDLWHVDLTEVSHHDEAYQIGCSEDFKHQTLRNDDMFLAVYNSTKNGGKISVLQSVQKRKGKEKPGKQKIPICSLHGSKNCPCFKSYKVLVKEEDELLNPGVPTVHSWDRTVIQDRPKHYKNKADEDGFNKTTFIYPTSRDSDMIEKLSLKHKGEFQYPDQFIPEYNFEKTCKHGNHFDPIDANLKCLSETSTIHSHGKEETLRIKVYGRGTGGVCECIDKPDTHSSLLHNMGPNGGGSYDFVCYTWLFLAILSFVNGTAISAHFNDRTKWLQGMKIEVSLVIKKFRRAVIGFCKNIRFRDEDWMCFHCGGGSHTPRYLVVDGKMMGPNKKYAGHLNELDRHEDDKGYLEQGCQHKNRVFFGVPIERKAIGNLLKNVTTYQDFLHENISSQTGVMVRDLLMRVYPAFNNELPTAYRRFLLGLTKNMGVNGLLQCKSDTALEILDQFCTQRRDLRNVSEIAQVTRLKKEIPVFWTILSDILKIETSHHWLPHDVSQIVRAVIVIRRNMFVGAELRFEHNYKKWPKRKGEHPTQFYPNWPICRYPKKYKVNKSVEEDLCQKSFPKGKDFTCGFLSVGCFCSKAITHGFELMVNPESSHNIFRLLQCRNLDRDLLDGIIYDHACNLNTYIMNREPRENQYLRTFVDKYHWHNHVGCSEGFNSANYGDSECFNTQNREQIHSRIEKVASSFKQMNYSSFMNMLRVFFGITNLKNKGLIHYFCVSFVGNYLVFICFSFLSMIDSSCEWPSIITSKY